MDRICGAILNKIHALSPAGHYVIVDEDELYEAFPEDCERTDDALERALSALKGSGYIDLKYSRGEMYCVAPLKEYIEESRPKNNPYLKDAGQTLCSYPRFSEARWAVL